MSWRNADGTIVWNANALKYLRLIAVALFALSACQIDGTGLILAPGWSYHSLGAWKSLTPTQIVLSPDGRWLYFGNETSEYTTEAGVVALHTSNGRTHMLVQGLANVHGMRFAPDGSLWVAEGGDQGEIWRMAEPEHFPDDQRVNALTRESTHPGFSPFRFAGRFAHRAIAFSADQRFAYLADAHVGGSLYRLEMRARRLDVFHPKKGWLQVVPEDAVIAARKLGAARFASISDIERLPDGTLLLAESGSGKILQLDDRGDQPVIHTWLHRDELHHPGDLAWDQSRQWLWITDEAQPSTLWAWDGHYLHDIVHHPASRISAVLAAGDHIYVNVQRGRNNPAMTLILKEKKLQSE